MRASVATLSAALVSLVSACKQQPVGDTPSGNPIATPGLAQQVPAGTPFTITWQPTTPGAVSIVLLRGPSTNVLPIDCIAESIPNSGSFVWTPSTALQPEATHYGIQIIVDGTGQYQYSTQFGISNAAYNSATSQSTTTTRNTQTATNEHTETATGTPPQTTSSAVVSQISDGQIQGSTSNATIVTSIHPIIVSTLSMNATRLTPTTSAPFVASTGAPHGNSTHLRGTKTMTVPKTLQSSAKKTTKTNHVVATLTGTTPASSPTSSAAVSSSPIPAPASGASHVAAAGGLIAGFGALFALLL